MKLAVVFPGQGSQTVGMGKDLYAKFSQARTVVDRVADRTGIPLSRLMWEGPLAELTATVNAQLALFACGVATWRVYEEVGGRAPEFFAGHSLGEYSALVASGALDLDAATDLVHLRGQSMAQAPAGSMAAIVGLEATTLAEICGRTTGTVVIANYNCPDQLVISGDATTVQAVGKAASTAGALRVLPLNVSGAFHSPLMLTALAPLEAALTQAPWRNVKVPIVHNVDAEPNDRAECFADRLSRQLANGVLWTDTVLKMRSAGIETILELGAGKTLTRLLRRIDNTLVGMAIDDEASLYKALEFTCGMGGRTDSDRDHRAKEQ